MYIGLARISVYRFGQDCTWDVYTFIYIAYI
jgi:hypothetical protein